MENLELRENLDLRKRVAEAIGCKAVLRTVNNLTATGKIYLFCECEGVGLNSHSAWVNGKLLVTPYELNHHLAIDALMDFCEKNDCRWELEDRRKTVPDMDTYLCRIIKSNMLCVTDHADLAKAICFNIQRAAQKSEKEAGE